MWGQSSSSMVHQEQSSSTFGLFAVNTQQMFAFMQHFSPQCNGVYLQFRDWFAFALRFVKRPELFERPINPLTCGGAASGTAE